MFLSKYFSLVLYGEYVKKIFIIDHEELQFDKNVGWTLLGINNEPNGLMSDHDYFFINEDLFNTVQSTHQKNNILLKIISNEPQNKSQCDATYICDENICKKKRTFGNNTLNNNIQRKRQKNSLYYRKNQLITTGW